MAHYADRTFRNKTQHRYSASIEQEDLMEFRLLYQGELLPSGNKNTRPAEKHAIRRVFHHQLRRQWAVHGGLNEQARSAGVKCFLDQGLTMSTLPAMEELVRRGIESIGQQWARFGYNFVPMVHDKSFVRCALDILILRPEDRKLIFCQGDLDGQVKTLFDALRMPRSKEELGKIGPQDDEDPFFCLLVDDNLISEVNVTSDQLLLLPTEKELKPNDTFVVIHVKINPKLTGAFGNFW